MTSVREVVVTGLGATTPLGGDVASTWAAALAGQSGARTLENDWAERYEIPVTFAAQIKVNRGLFEQTVGVIDLGIEAFGLLHLRLNATHELALQESAFQQVTNNRVVSPDVHDAFVVAEVGVAEEVIVVRVRVRKGERQIGNLAHRCHEFLRLARSPTGIDHQGLL